MFTGIIEDKGRISKIVPGKVHTIHIQSNLENKQGDSIAIQGICLTVTAVDTEGFAVEAMRQTEKITTLPNWRAGDYVNIERALNMGDRIGGHIILGHVDEIATCIRIKANEYFFKIAPQSTKYLIPKGSIAINGVSLTVRSITKNMFSVSLIPYTLKTTTLGSLKTRSSVNIEYDYLVKILTDRMA